MPQDALAVAQVALSPRQPLLQLRVVDAAVKEDDETQPAAPKRVDERRDVKEQLLELATAHPIERLLVQPADEAHAVDHHDVRAAAMDARQRHRVVRQRQALLHERLEALDAHVQR